MKTYEYVLCVISHVEYIGWKHTSDPRRQFREKMNIAHTLKKIYEEKKMHIDVGADIIYCNVHTLIEMSS